ncbi:MAG: proton-conducting transporter transmembrane domain-containing protein [Acidimicrobiales bacterium]
MWALLAVPLASGTGLAICGRRADRAAAPVGVAAASATLGLAVTAAFRRPSASAPLFTGMRAAFAIDGLSAVLVVTVTAVTVAVLVFAAADIAAGEARSRFFGVMLVFAGAMVVTVTATTLAVLLMGWEVMGATSWALIGFWWHDRRRVEAGTTAFVTTRAGDVGLYLAAGAAVAGGAGSLRLDVLPRLGSPWLDVVTAGVVVAALGKSAQLPFSFWLSRAMEGPSPVSALLHSATMVAAGAYLLLRLHPLLVASGWGQPVVAWAGVATAVALGLVAVAQRDLKQLLAASTCAQIGFMILAAGAGGVAAGTAQLVAHAAVKSLLFLAAGAWLSALGTNARAARAGAGRRYRLVGATFTAGALALAGIPPLSLWATKDAILAAALARNPALYAAGLAAAVISAVYSIRAARLIWLPAPVEGDAAYDTERTGTRRVGPLMAAPLVPLAVAAVGLGVYALPAAATAFERTVGARGEPGPPGWALGLSAGLALSAAAATWRLTGRVRVPVAVGDALGSWLGLETATHIVVVRPTLRAAGALARFDDLVVDGAVRRLAAAAVGAAGLAARVGEVGVDDVVAGVASGARSLGRLARRPQTGLVHQYYAQAAAVLVALVAIMVLVG